MDDFEKPFALSPEPGIEHVGKDEVRLPWLRFTGGEILALARFAIEKKDQQPVLVVHCERGENQGLHSYMGYRIDSLAFSTKGISINFHYPEGQRFQLKLDPDETSSSSGTVISHIDTLKEYFPMEEYMAFREGLQRQQVVRVQQQLLQHKK
jgi:hypothetical protein